MKSKILEAGVVGAFIFWSNSALAEPILSSLSKTDSAGQTIFQLEGTGFGNLGPNILLVEDFESDQRSAEIWDRGSPVLDSIARSGSNSHLGHTQEAGDGSNNILGFDFGGDFDEVFVSYWVKLGTDYFPGSGSNGDSAAPRKFPDPSSWKMAWLMDTADGFRNDGLYDLCVPQYSGLRQMTISGNEGAFRWIGRSWWSWGSWIRLSVWIKNDRNVHGLFQAVSAEHGVYEDIFDESPFYDDATKVVSYMTLPGWMRDSTVPVRPVYDDVYVAAGPGAIARVEIADSPVYEQAKRLEIGTVTAWNSGSITVGFADSLAIPEAGYVFVTDADGQRNSVGFSICDDCPLPPDPF